MSEQPHFYEVISGMPGDDLLIMRLDRQVRHNIREEVQTRPLVFLEDETSLFNADKAIEVFWPLAVAALFIGLAIAGFAA